MFNQQIDDMVNLVILCCGTIALSKHLKDAEIFYIFKCLKHLMWDAGFQAQIYVKQEGLTNVHTMQSLQDKGLFTSTCILTLKMKKCLGNYPGLVGIIQKYTGKSVHWHCPNEQ